jgi:signal transduction histidine kinase
VAQYGATVVSDEVRRIVPIVAVVVAIVAALVDPSTPGELLLLAIPPAALAAWTYLPRVPLPAVAIAVLVPVVVVQHSGHHEPIMFEASLLAFVVACWTDSLALAAALGLLAVAAPIVVGAIETSGNLGVGIWVVGVAFPWLIGRAIHRQMQLAAALESTRRELAEQAMLEERRRIARDVHDFVGHGLAAVMLQVTSARHVLRRDPDAAEEALRTAEDVGRRSMRELRRTVAFLRSDEEDGVAPPVPVADEIPALVDQARSGGVDVELRLQGDLARVEPGIGLALYRIAQEALANAARHAPHARTTLTIEVGGGEATLVADTVGPVAPAARAGDHEGRSYGVVGMGERATAVGGVLSAGPTVEGWRVSCRLPFGTPAET